MISCKNLDPEQYDPDGCKYCKWQSWKCWDKMLEFVRENAAKVGVDINTGEEE